MMNSSSIVDTMTMIQDDDDDLVGSNFATEESLVTSTTTITPTAAPTTFLDTYKDEWYENKWMLVTPRVTALISLFAIVCVAIEAYMDLQVDYDIKKRRKAFLEGSGILEGRISTASGATSASVATGTTVSTRRNNLIIVSRIQLFYQIPLFVYTLALTLGTTPVPEGQAWGSFGTITSCSFQGWLLQFGIHGVMGWDSVLSLTYLLMVRYSKKHVANNPKQRLLNLEKYYHLIIWPFALVVSIIPLTQDLYNFNNYVCWVESYPDNCVGEECVRGGEGATVWQNLTSYLSMVHLFYSIIIMITLYCSIRGLEVKTSTSPSASNDDNNNNTTPARSPSTIILSASTTAARRRKRQRQRQHSRAIGFQGMLYCSGMIMTIFPSAFYIVLWNATGIWSTGFSIFATAVVPLVGYVNFCIFMRGRSQENCHTSYAKVLRRFHSILFDCCYKVLRCNHVLCHDCQPRSSSPSSSSSDNHRDGHSVGNVAAAPSPTPSPPNQQQQQQQVHDDNDDIEQSKDGTASAAGLNHHGSADRDRSVVLGNDTSMVPSRIKNKGSWSGTMIWGKLRGSQRSFSQWISELGASGISEEEEEDSEYDDDDDDDEEEEEEEDSTRSSELDLEDAPPTPPAKEVVDKRPPSKPMRILSEIIPSEIDNVDGSSGNQHEETIEVDKRQHHWHPFHRFSRTIVAPPTKPERYISEVEAPPPASTTTTTTTELEKQKPPTKPERSVSEVEYPTAATEVTNSATKQKPPTGPERRISLVDPPTTSTITDHSGTKQDPPSKPERRTSEVEPPTTTRTTVINNHSATRKPPTMPVRFVSELEASFSTGNTEMDHVGMGNN